MKLALVLFLFSVSSWSKPVVLLGYFDAFGNDPFNNSEVVAKDLEQFSKNNSDFEIRLCALKTVFDKSYFQFETCLKDLPEDPKFILALGESNCNLKIETIVRNFDRTIGADNEGNERFGEDIIPGGPKAIGLNYPLAQMFCSLQGGERKKLEVSNNAGSFVCNNLAYQFAHYYPKLSFGFIHVPANNCRNLNARTDSAIKSLQKMISAAVKVETFNRLSTHKNEIEVLRRSSRNNACLSEFYKRTKGIDEKGFWPF